MGAIGAIVPLLDDPMVRFIFTNKRILTGRQFTTNISTRGILWRLKSFKICLRSLVPHCLGSRLWHINLDSSNPLPTSTLAPAMPSGSAPISSVAIKLLSVTHELSTLKVYRKGTEWFSDHYQTWCNCLRPQSLKQQKNNNFVIVQYIKSHPQAGTSSRLI